MLDGIAKSLSASLNRDEGTVEVLCDSQGLTSAVLRLLQLVISLEASVGYLSVVSAKQKPLSRHRLGPRVSTRIAHSIRPLLRPEMAQRNIEVSGYAVDAWQVDFLYQPRRMEDRGKLQASAVAIIAVDLAVKNPMSKASDALARAWDIKSRHEDFEIRVALDTHQQNGHVLGAKKLLEEHHESKFLVHDLTTKQLLATFTSQIRAELGAAM